MAIIMGECEDTMIMVGVVEHGGVGAAILTLIMDVSVSMKNAKSGGVEEDLSAEAC